MLFDGDKLYCYICACMPPGMRSIFIFKVCSHVMKQQYCKGILKRLDRFLQKVLNHFFGTYPHSIEDILFSA